MRAGLHHALLVVLLVALGLAPWLRAAPAFPAVEPYQQGDFGGFLNILPPGENGFENAADAAHFESSHTYPSHWVDQYGMYRDLVYAAPGLSAADIANFFKDASFGVRATDVERVYSPPLRSGVTIVRDGFGVPHVYGDTRSDVEYGAGYVSAEDRLFFMDALRHAGRAQLSGFAGGTNKEMDREQWQIAPYNEEDLQLQYDMADEFYGAEGAQLQRDVQDYVDGVNGYILEARLNPSKMPVEYAAIQKPLEDWKPADLIATASLIGGIFGKGGGREVDNAQVLQAARRQFGASRGVAVFRDFRRAEDAEAPTTVRGTSFPYQVPGKIDPNAVAEPDPGSVTDPEGTSPAPLGTAAALSGPLAGLLAFPSGNSNALLVSGASSQSGHPVAVMGPQVAYFIPEILMEVDLHCIADCQGGLAIDARGATFPGVSLYVLLGRGPDFAWSATSAGQDIIDTFADPLCEPNGSAPTIRSMSYVYKGQCRPIEVLTRTNNITPNAADPSPPETFVLTAQRTVHGIVYKRGTVGGTPVAFTRLRSTYFHEADSARAFADLNSPQRVQNATDFQHAVAKINFTFNWFYADDRDVAYFNSGDNPVRAPGVDPDLPTTGGGTYDWRNYDPVRHTANYTSFSQHPQVINQSYITSWNNKQAPLYRAADDNYAYGPLFRSMPLDDRIQQVLNSGDKMTLEKLIDAMEDAGTVDLRGDKALPWMLQVVGQPSDPQLAGAVSTLRAWMNSGAHRIDRDRDGHYDDEPAVQIMDAWWPRAAAAEFKPVLGQELFDDIQAMMGFDDAPNSNGSHLGSAYIAGWYGYVQKDLRKLLGAPLKSGLSRVYCGKGSLSRCRDALLGALKAALSVPASSLYDEDPSSAGTQRVSGCPDSSSDQWCFDSIRFRPLGAITVDTIHWVNRPTFQQAVEVQGHRPR